MLNLEGLWTRYDDPEPLLAEIAVPARHEATRRLQEIYAEPIKPDLMTQRVKADPRVRRHGRPVRCLRS